MNKPIRLGPWRHFPGVGWARTFTHCDVDGAQTNATGWRLWPPVEYEVPPLASGPETGLEGRQRADEAARALGWELEGTASPLPDLLRLADLVLAFGRVERVTRHPDGLRPESDAEHTLMLAFVALTLADEHPEWGLDAGRLAVLALVHDLPEVYAGDTNTAGGLTPSQQADKVAREQAATEHLHRELPGSVIMRALTTYERQDTPEARFLRVLDKVMPKLTHALNFGAALRELGMSVADMQAAHAAQRAKLFAECPEWKEALGPLLDEAARVAEKAAAERERYDATVKEVVDELRARRAAEEKAYSDAYGFGEGVPESGGEPMRPGEHQHRARVSAAWPGFEGESYLPGARLAPQPERYSAGFATGWAWRGRRWLDGHTPPAPIANHGGLGWCWADLGLSPCVCGGANRFRVGSIYLCAECRESAGEVSGG